MKLGAALSPYGLAATGRVFMLVLIVAAAAAAWSGREVGASLLLLGMFATMLVFRAVSECPVCGKSPYIRFYGDGVWPGRWFWRETRWWPERQCSDCGSRLDDI